jgi:4-hydroxythreonine-4-phosphate dehydrogenase
VRKKGFFLGIAQKKEVDLQGHPVFPVIGITMGDPSGIGPEIVLKSVAREEVREVCVPVIVGKRYYLEKLTEYLGLSLRFSSLPKLSAEALPLGSIPCVEPADLSFPTDAVGVCSPAAGRAALSCLREAATLCFRRRLDGLVTAPVSKEAIRAGGVPFSGHTEFLRELTGVPRTGMLFTTPTVKVGLFTTHTALREAIERVRKEALAEAIRFFFRETVSLFGEKPRIAVASLNPHAGEGGAFGREEEEEIRPAVSQCAREGIPVEGPFPADTLYIMAKRGRFNFLLFLFHDQAMILVKALFFRNAVNVTLGLPFPRTSPAHGVAFDLAGKGRADASSMVEAILQCARLCLRKTRAVDEQESPENSEH